MTRSFDAFSPAPEQPRRRWFESPSRSLWRTLCWNKYYWGIRRIILSWCWWNFLTSANQIAQIGSCDRSRIYVSDLGGTGVWPGKNGFHKKYKNFDDIAVYLIASLKSKWKKYQIKNMNNWIWWLLFIYVLEGNLQWNSLIFKMIDYLKGSIVKFKLNFEKVLQNKWESVWWWQISRKHCCVKDEAIYPLQIICIFKKSSYQNILIDFDMFPKNDDGYFLFLFWLSVQLNFSVTNLAVPSQWLLQVLPRINNQVTWPQDVHMSPCCNRAQFLDKFKHSNWQYSFIHP